MFLQKLSYDSILFPADWHISSLTKILFSKLFLKSSWKFVNSPIKALWRFWFVWRIHYYYHFPSKFLIARPIFLLSKSLSFPHFFLFLAIFTYPKTYSVKQLIFDSFCRISGFTTTLVLGICVNDLFTAAAYFIKNLNLHCFLTLIKFTTKKFILLLGSRTRFALQWLW